MSLGDFRSEFKSALGSLENSIYHLIRHVSPIILVATKGGIMTTGGIQLPVDDNDAQAWGQGRCPHNKSRWRFQFAYYADVTETIDFWLAVGKCSVGDDISSYGTILYNQAIQLACQANILQRYELNLNLTISKDQFWYFVLSKTGVGSVGKFFYLVYADLFLE